MLQSPAPGEVEGFRDRRTALLVAGILLIVLGAGAWLMALLSGLGGVVMARQGLSMASVIPGLLMYAGMGAVAVTVGVGTLRARRWARALGQALSAGGLLFGLGSGVAMGLLMPRMMKAVAPPDAGAGGAAAIAGVVMLIMVALMFLLFVGVPLGYLLFYRNPHVRATCEAADSEVSWVDGIPAPVLTASVWLGVMAVGLLVVPFAYAGKFPLLGRWVEGVAGWGLWFLAAPAGAVAAWGTGRCRWWAWGLGLVLLIGLGISGIVTFLHTDMRAVYEAMGMVGPQIDMIERMGMLDASYAISTSLGGLIPFLVLMLAAVPALAGASRVRKEAGVGR